ncbi:MAG TPA: hypothetical protein VIG75_05945 [Citricoccus sp.]
MSTYLTTVVPRALEERFATWLGRVDPQDHVVVDLPDTPARVHHVARAARSDVVTGAAEPREAHAVGVTGHTDVGDAVPLRLDPRGMTLFRGYAQEPEGTSLVFGARGLADYRRTPGAAASRWGRTAGTDWDGCHLLVSLAPDGLTATTDFFRQLPLLYTAAAGFVAWSDSWALLVDLRRALGLEVTVDTSAALASSWSNTMANHPLSATTLCHEVRMLPPGARLRVPVTAAGATVPRTDQEPWPQLFAAPSDSWGAEVRRAAVRTASLAQAWASAPGASVRLALSGGVDSRLVLAATLMADPTSDVTVYNTTHLGPANRADAQTVQALSERFGFPVGAAGRPAPRPVLQKYTSPLSVWLLDSLGLNHQLALPSFRVDGSGFFTVSGHGAGIHKGAYGWRSVPALQEEIAASDPQLAEAVGASAADLLREVGIAPEQGPHATEWHYLAVRNSIHGGRFAIQNMLGPRPLMQRQLVALAHVDQAGAASPPDRIGPAWSTTAGNHSLTAAVLSVLDPDLASAPYDHPAKAITPETIDAVLAATGGPLDPSERHAVTAFGAPADVVNGPALVFERWAGNQLGHHLAQAPGPMTEDAGVHAQVGALVDSGFEAAADAGFADWFRPTSQRARDSIAAGGPLSHARGDAGTLMAFLPLAGAGASAPIPSRRDQVTTRVPSAPEPPDPSGVAGGSSPGAVRSPLRRAAGRVLRSVRRLRREP